MTVSIKIECDNCGRIKQETNHWYMTSCFPTMEPARINILPFKLEDANVAQVILCGEACVHAYISQNLSSLHNL